MVFLSNPYVAHGMGESDKNVSLVLLPELQMEDGIGKCNFTGPLHATNGQHVKSLI
jgi:hypothetical protein